MNGIKCVSVRLKLKPVYWELLCHSNTKQLAPPCPYPTEFSPWPQKVVPEYSIIIQRRPRRNSSSVKECQIQNWTSLAIIKKKLYSQIRKKYIVVTRPTSRTPDPRSCAENPIAILAKNKLFMQQSTTEQTGGTKSVFARKDEKQRGRLNSIVRTSIEITEGLYDKNVATSQSTILL